MFLDELSEDDVVCANFAVLKRYRQEHLHNPKPKGLGGCLGGIFYRDAEGTYLSGQLEDMAGLVLLRIAEGQYFIEGNKRTAVVACSFFLRKNGLLLDVDAKRFKDIIVSFGLHSGQKSSREVADEAKEFVRDFSYAS